MLLEIINLMMELCNACGKWEWVSKRILCYFRSPSEKPWKLGSPNKVGEAVIGGTMLANAAKPTTNNKLLEDFRKILNEKIQLNSDSKGSSLLALAARHGLEEKVVEILESGLVDLEKTNELGQTALMEACAAGHVNVCKTLIKKGANLGAVDYEGETPIIMAVRSGKIDLLSLLLEKDTSNIEKQNRAGATALIVACQNGIPEATSLLLENGANVTNVDYYGDSPLIKAAYLGMEEIVDLLLRKDESNVNHQNEWGRTALMEACISGHEGIVQLLIDRGTQIDVMDKDGLSALMHVARRGSREGTTVSRLLDADRSTLEQKNRFGETALIKACRAGQEAVASILIENDADIEATDHAGNTAIHYAAYNLHEGIVKLLLYAPKTTLNVKNSSGKTPLQNVFKRLHDNENRQLPNFDYTKMWSICQHFRHAGAMLELDPSNRRSSIGSLSDSDNCVCCPLSEIALHMRRNSSAVNLSSYPERSATIPRQLCRRSSLQSISRDAILQQLPLGLENRQTAISDLYLPEMLKTFLNFDELI